MANQAPRLLRNYRSMVPSRFYAFNLQVSRALAANISRLPEWVWAMNPLLLANYFAASEQHERVFHAALLRSKVAVSERDLLQAQLTLYLDEIAAYLEAAAVRCPEVLLASGFPVAKQLKGRISAKFAPPQPDAARVEYEIGDAGSGI